LRSTKKARKKERFSVLESKDKRTGFVNKEVGNYVISEVSI